MMQFAWRRQLFDVPMALAAVGRRLPVPCADDRGDHYSVRGGIYRTGHPVVLSGGGALQSPPTRRPPRAMLLAGLSCCAATATATAVVVNQGYPMRVPDLVRDVIPRFQDDIGKRIRHGVCFLERDKGPDGFANRCFERQATKKTVFIWGDSFAAHLWFGF